MNTRSSSASLMRACLLFDAARARLFKDGAAGGGGGGGVGERPVLPASADSSGARPEAAASGRCGRATDISVPTVVRIRAETMWGSGAIRIAAIRIALARRAMAAACACGGGLLELAERHFEVEHLALTSDAERHGLA